MDSLPCTSAVVIRICKGGRRQPRNRSLSPSRSASIGKTVIRVQGSEPADARTLTRKRLDIQCHRMQRQNGDPGLRRRYFLKSAGAGAAAMMAGPPGAEAQQQQVADAPPRPATPLMTKEAE